MQYNEILMADSAKGKITESNKVEWSWSVNHTRGVGVIIELGVKSPILMDYGITNT